MTKAELFQELPQDRVDRERRQLRERAERIERLRAEPESERTEDEHRALRHVPFHIPHSFEGHEREEIGIDRHHNFYFPVSALHEPFASLFAKKPEIALQLVRGLANHGTTGWRQVANITRRQHGTPIPITITFPWGEQHFWGDWQAYNWQLGQLGAQPLECAFLAMGYWAFCEIDKGRSVDELIQLVVQGNESVAAAGLALRLALETLHLSEVTLTLVGCQRLWEFDIARVRQEPTRNLDLFGFGFLNQLTGDKKVAEEYLNKRQSRSRDVRRLAMQFAVNGDEPMTERFKQALADFVNTLPYEVEEQRSNPDTTAALMKQAREYAALAVAENYRGYRTPDDRVMVAYQPPLSPAVIQRGEAAGIYLHQSDFLAWAMKSLRAFALDPGKTLADAVALARPLDHGRLFAERQDVGDHTPQSLVAAVAACVVCFGAPATDEYKWAIAALKRIDNMKEPKGYFNGSKIAWHPALQLIYALLHLRRSNPGDLEPARRLLRLTAHPHQEASDFAFMALLADPDLHISWVTAQLALTTSLYYRPIITPKGERDSRAGHQARKAALNRALAALKSTTFEAIDSLPPAGIKAQEAADLQDDDEDRWREPDPLFDPQRAQKHLESVPIEEWCTAETTKAFALALLRRLVEWTASRMNPPGSHTRQHQRTADLIEWNDALGKAMSRAVPYFDVDLVKKEFLSPFLANHDDDELDVVAQFADDMVRRHVLDADVVSSNTLELLNRCVDHVIGNSTFQPSGYRAGEVSGRDMPHLIEALLMVNVERAPRAARYVNGDWSQIGLVMPMVTRLVSATGWSAFIMSKFLLLCERAGTAYPLDNFSEQVSAVIGKIDLAKGSWAGTTLPARTAATVQRLADANFPLRAEQAQGLLRILDALIDLGDRRSAALEQNRGVQGRPSAQSPLRLATVVA